MPAQTRLKKSREEISLAAYGETKAQTMLAAELSEINPKTAASFQCTRGAERFAALVGNLERTPERLDDSAHQRGGNSESRQDAARRCTAP